MDAVASSRSHRRDRGRLRRPRRGPRFLLSAARVSGPALAPAPPIARPTPARALGAEERETVRAVLNSEALPGLLAGRHSGHLAR